LTSRTLRVGLASRSARRKELKRGETPFVSPSASLSSDGVDKVGVPPRTPNCLEIGEPYSSSEMVPLSVLMRRHRSHRGRLCFVGTGISLGWTVCTGVDVGRSTVSDNLALHVAVQQVCHLYRGSRRLISHLIASSQPCATTAFIIREEGKLMFIANG